MCDIKFSTLKGLTLQSIVGKVNGKEMIFETVDGRKFKLFHEEDCCEHVYIEDICGNLDDLIGSEILWAESASNDKNENLKVYEYPEDRQDSCTWTFYKLSTIKDSVTIRWYGCSNGYYSEEVSFVEIDSKPKEIIREKNTKFCIGKPCDPEVLSFEDIDGIRTKKKYAIGIGEGYCFCTAWDGKCHAEYIYLG